MNKNFRFLVFFVAFLMLRISNVVFSQPQNFTFNYLSSLDGLSNNSVTGVVEDSRGFLWIATRDGLNQFNGYTFKQFKKELDNNNSLPDNHIVCLAEDKSDNLWVGTNQSGLSRYNFAADFFRNYYPIEGDENSIPGKFIRKIKVDSRDGIWIATDKGLAKYNPDTDNFKRFLFPLNNGKQERNVDVRGVFQIDDNEIIIQSKIGLFKVNLNNENVSRFELPFFPLNSAVFNEEYPLLFDRAKNIWLGTLDGLVKYNLISHEYKIYKHSDSNNRSVSSHIFSSIFQDKKGNIWIGTLDAGVNLYHTKTDDFTGVMTSNQKGKGLSGNGVNQIYEDSHGNIWISTQEGGISFINSSNSYFEYFCHDPFDKRSITRNIICTFFEDQSGTLWISPDDRFLSRMIGNNEFVSYPIFTDFVTPAILGVVQTQENKLLVTGWGVGLHEFDIQKGTFKNLMEGVKINGKPLDKFIKGIGTDSDGNVWLTSHNSSGIIVYNIEENKFYNHESPGHFNPELMKVPYSASMIQDRKGRIWIVSYSGLFMFDGKFHTFQNLPNDKNTLSSDYVYTLFEDRAGELWVGNSNGLDKIMESEGNISFERMNYSHLIPNNIKGILQDKKGYLWLSSNTELTQFHPETKKIIHHKINNKLSSPEFYERACLLTSSGEMYFGGTSGFFRFRPDSITDDQNESKVYITDFSLFNKSQSVNTTDSPLKKSIFETTQIDLKYNQSVLSFEYVALNFNPYKSIAYAYKLEGFDNDWTYAGERRTVTYTNLPAGDYTFKVKLVEGNEISNTRGTELKLIIHPPLWKTNWAYAAYIVMFSGVLYLLMMAILYRQKLENELKLERINIQNVSETNLMKLRFFTNISHEFRTPLTLIKAPLEKLTQACSEHSDPLAKFHLSLIQKNTERLLKMVNQLMDYRKLEAGSLILEPSYGDVVEFSRNIWSTFGFLAQEKNIDYTFHSQLESHRMYFDPDKLDKILSNLLSNAFKYTQKYGHVSVAILRTTSDEYREIIEIRVKDSGIGISEKDLSHIFERFYSVNPKKGQKIEGTGIGLTLAKELTELHKGKISVRSTLGEGAEFTVQLPIINYEKLDQEEETEGVIYTNTLVHASTVNKIDIEPDTDSKAIKPIILLVEDDNDLREFIKNELKSDYTVIVARNGEEGLRKASLELPNLVLSDVMMPVMDGFELCKTLKADERTSHLPVILLTARQSQEQQLEGFDAGADEYIFKPFSVAMLKSRVQNLLNNRNKIVEKFKTGKSLNFDSTSPENKDTRFIQSIIDLVLENITDENINADYIAKKMLVSRTLVYLKIEAITGQTVNEFIRNIRLKKSLQLLEQKNLTVTEIAYAVGFSSQSYYTRSFKKQYGVSPKEAI